MNKGIKKLAPKYSYFFKRTLLLYSTEKIIPTLGPPNTQAYIRTRALVIWKWINAVVVLTASLILSVFAMYRQPPYAAAMLVVKIPHIFSAGRATIYVCVCTTTTLRTYSPIYRLFDLPSNR